MEEEILRFIKIFQSPSNKILFTECACYWFAHILHTRFSRSEIVYNPDRVHFATLIDGNIYDITGKIEDEGYFNWSSLERLEAIGDMSKDMEFISDLDTIRAECIYFRGGEYLTSEAMNH